VEGAWFVFLSSVMKSVILGVVVFLIILGCSTNEFQHEDEKQEVRLKQEKICLLAISKLDSTLLEKLSTDLEKIFGQKVEVSQNPLNLEFAYNLERDQYHSSVILEKLQMIGSGACERILGIVDVDLYVPDLNFIFGEANVVDKKAVISTKRLRPDYYGLPEDERLLRERTLKESVHELGHTYGLGHCPDKKCVMYFSNSLPDTDIKSSSFCENCKKKLMLVRRLKSSKDS
jgi:archaemetzincin